jgi:glutamine amidotransferase
MTVNELPDIDKREVVIVDVGMGNIGSVANMVKFIGGAARISSEVDVVASAKSLILPGVGNFAYGMQRLRDLKLTDALEEAKRRGSRILGICLGMQLMTQWCEEGFCEGLGWFDLKTLRFSGTIASGETLPVPHMGWNQVNARPGATHFDSIPIPSRFYFVHSYYVDGAQADDCLATTLYGDTCFASAIGSDNVLGVQFHPEKSHKYGIAFLKHFIAN